MRHCEGSSRESPRGRPSLTSLEVAVASLGVPPLSSLEAYLERIGLARGSDPSLAAVHRAHATTIAFENFDTFSGTPVSLALEDLEDKMVARRRGGYCFEHNLLLAAALESLGGREVSPLLARVRILPDGMPRPLNHLLLRVRDRDGSTWLADVGFGGGGLLTPIPFAPGSETDQSGWRYRLVEDGPEMVLQAFQDGGWTDLYGFVPEPVEHIDIEVNNWYTATHPESSFVTGVMVGRRAVNRCLSLFAYEDAVVVERPVGGASTTTEVALRDVPALLAERFGVFGVAVNPNGRLALESA
jgi:N-hydroxyarylamine O-acetyltransferase